MSLTNVRQVRELLAKDRWVAFATIDHDQPRVRMMTVNCHKGRLWCFTSSSSAKAGQLRKNDKFEFVANLFGEGDTGSLRAIGRVEIVNDPSVKKELAASFESFKQHWQSSADPDFMLLRLHVGTVEVERGPDAKAEKFVLSPAL